MQCTAQKKASVWCRNVPLRAEQRNGGCPVRMAPFRALRVCFSKKNRFDKRPRSRMYFCRAALFVQRKCAFLPGEGQQNRAYFMDRGGGLMVY